jgi:hypothetical protein
MLPYSNTPGRYYMYIFSCFYGELVSFDTNTNTMATLRPLPQWPRPDFCGQTVAQGSSRLLMLKPGNSYSPEVVMFGGTSLNGECGRPTWVLKAGGQGQHCACRWPCYVSKTQGSS